MKLTLCKIILLWYLITIISVLIHGRDHDLSETFKVICRWKQLEFQDIPDDQGDIYIPSNNIPFGFALAPRSKRIFVSVVRINPGVPSTVNYFYEDECNREENPKLRPYPDYATNSIQYNDGPERLINVFRLTVDCCNRLWFVDTGTLDYRRDKIFIHKPTIWVMDLYNDSVIRRFSISDKFYTIDGLGFVNINVEIDGQNCNNAFAYVSNYRNAQLLIYSFRENDAWIMRHPYMKPVPGLGEMMLEGVSFKYPSGIFPMALSPSNSEDRLLFFGSLAGIAEYAVPTRILKDRSLSPDKYNIDDFIQIGSRGPNSQILIQQINSQGILFYPEIQDKVIKCWNTGKPLTPENTAVVYENNQTMIYGTEVQIDEDDNIWVMSNRFPLYLFRGLDPNEYNFFLVRGKSDAVKNTVCSL
ncbi:hypothetical protein DMENIID0001_107380 [Sergentomyia squamirostris]